jgi:argininosuccinate synthase
METYGCKVIAFLADLGQEEDFQSLKKRALKTGADKVYIEDLKEEFVKDFVFPILRANAIYEGSYLLGTSIARPLIAKRQIEIARKEKADAVSHGATGKGNDQVRFELTYLALNPRIKIVAPWRIWNFNSRQSLINYAKKHKIPLEVSAKKPYSIDRNLFHISFEGGILEDPWQEPKEDMFILTTSPERAPAKPTYVEITYKKGNPVAVNNRSLSPAGLLAKLNKMAGTNGIGRVDLVENRYVGMKSRGVYETPGGTILHKAHRALESITLDREVMHLKDSLVTKYAELVYYGYWYAPEREILQRTMDETQTNVTGTVRLKLYKGNCTVVGRKSPKSLYRPDYATFEEDAVYDQKLADGFIQLNALRLKIRSLVQKKK